MSKAAMRAEEGMKVIAIGANDCARRLSAP
jgi:hypothetical protein